MVATSAAVILGPGCDIQAGERGEGHCQLEGPNVAANVGGDLREHAGHNGRGSIPHGTERKRAPDPLFGESPDAVLRHHPRLKGREEERRRDAAEHATNEQQSHVVEVLEEIDGQLECDVHEARALAAVSIHKRAGRRAEDGSSHKACEEQRADSDVAALLLGIAGVERVHVCALHPVGQHYDHVHREVRALEGSKVGCLGLIGDGRLLLRSSAVHKQPDKHAKQRHSDEDDKSADCPFAASRLRSDR